MQKNRIRGPVITLAAVAALGGGLWWVNAAQQGEPAAAPAPVVAVTVDNAAAPSAPPKRPVPVQFPASAAYSGVIAARTGVTTVDITVTGDEAVAYVCDGESLEMWLRGSARDGALDLADRDRSARLSGSLNGAAVGGPFVAGTLWIGERTWDFTAAASVAGDDGS